MSEWRIDLRAASRSVLTVRLRESQIQNLRKLGIEH
jgi:hypothetical protein